MRTLFGIFLPIAALAWPALLFAGCDSDLGDLGEDELAQLHPRAMLGDDREHCNGPWICNVQDEQGWIVADCYTSQADCQQHCSSDNYGTSTLCGYDESYDDPEPEPEPEPEPCDGPWICNVQDEQGWVVDGCFSSQADCQAGCSGPNGTSTVCGYDESYEDRND